MYRAILRDIMLNELDAELIILKQASFNYGMFNFKFSLANYV